MKSTAPKPLPTLHVVKSAAAWARLIPHNVKSTAKLVRSILQFVKSTAVCGALGCVVGQRAGTGTVVRSEWWEGVVGWWRKGVIGMGEGDVNADNGCVGWCCVAVEMG